ncbi:MAG: hypothetical protein ACSHYB_14425 [Roseibacillus sp.]
MPAVENRIGSDENWQIICPKFVIEIDCGGLGQAEGDDKVILLIESRFGCVEAKIPHSWIGCIGRRIRGGSVELGPKVSGFGIPADLVETFLRIRFGPKFFEA